MIIEMIGDVAVQATQQVLELGERMDARFLVVDSRFLEIEQRLGGRMDSLEHEMREMKNQNATFHDELVGYLRRAEQERAFTSVHLKRHDEQIAELQVAAGIA